ncbi:hypothetical protein [Sphingomonas cynarae]
MRAATGWLLALLAAGCSGAAMKQEKVGGHVFNLPEQALEEENVFFLPKDDYDGLYFVLGSETAPAEQVRVILGTTEKFCNFNTPPVIDQVPRACAVARGQAPQPKTGRLTRVARSAGATVNRYVYKGEDGGVAVSCRSEDGQSGTCSATFAWRDLVWDATFDEQWVPKLDELRAEVAKRLDEWSGDA